MPILVRELHGQADQLLGEAVVAGDFEALLQMGRDDALVLVPVLPEHGVAAVRATLRVSDVENVAQERPAIAVAQQGYAFRAAPDVAAHPAAPEVELGTRFRARTLRMDHDLVEKPVFVDLACRDQKFRPIPNLGGQALRGVVRHLAVGFRFRCHLRRSLLIKLEISTTTPGAVRHSAAHCSVTC